MIKLLLTLIPAFTVTANAQVQRYDRVKVRQHLLDMTTNRGVQKIQVRGAVPADSNKREFVTYYLNAIQPTLEQIQLLDQRSSVLHLLIDTGSEDSAAEKAAWQKEYSETTSKMNAYSVDEEWNRKVQTWGKLAGKLKGELPDYARRYALEAELEQFAGSSKQKLDAISDKITAYRDVINNAKAAKGMSESRQGTVKAVRDYKTGTISFKEAQARLSDLYVRVGTRFVGAEAAQSHGHLLNEAAILRSQLAKEKGYPTWAEYKLQASGQGYETAYRGAANQRKFLRAWITQTRPIDRAYYDRRLKEMGLDPVKDDIRDVHLALLTPPDLALAQPYFPADKLTDIWQETMLESGFSKEMMKSIVVDDMPREGKNPTGAYMSPVITPSTAVRVLDYETLNFDAAQEYRPSLIYVTQSFRGAGIGDFRTGFHELTGHAFEYLTKDKDQQTSEGYGYVETPSTTAEYFLRDPEYLWAKAIPVNGEKPQRSKFAEWVENSKRGDALGLTSRASSALYDIDIWDYDYSAPGALTYMQRVEIVSGEIDKLSSLYPSPEGGVPRHFFYVSTNHFISGSVRNIGYSYASIASRMMYDHITEKLKKETGRTTWNNQPGLAKIFINDFYREGWKTQFPGNIEKITGRKFDLEKVLKEITAPLTE